MDFISIGKEIGELVQEKNKAYGNSFNLAHKLLEVLYPNGIQPEQYTDALSVIRIIDKLFRVASLKNAFGENPWRDIAGYSILSVAREKRKEE